MIKLEFKKVDSKDELPWTVEIYSMEIGYDGKPTRTMVGTINDKTKQVRPTHGYFPPHKTGNKIKIYAKAVGYDFIA